MEMKKELVSVIIPNYNRSKLLLRAVKSVLNQSISDIEVIVVDDASTDDSVDKIRELRDDRLKIIVLEHNSGACIARNKGIDIAGGEYIAFLDSDDEWLADKLKLQLDYMKRENQVACFAQYYLYGLKKKKRKLCPGVIDVSNGIYQSLLYENCIATCTLIIKREALGNIRFDVRLKRYQDWDLALQISSKINIAYLEQPVMNVYEQANSITKSTSKRKKYESLCVIFEKYKMDIIKNQSAYSHFMWTMGLYHLYIDKADLRYIKKSVEMDRGNKKKLLVYTILKMGGGSVIAGLYGLNH